MHSRIKTTLVCAALLLLFAGVSWTAINSKGAAYDEPYHAVSAWLQLHYGDYRIDNEDPPLWQYWASLPNGKHALSADFTSPNWLAIPNHVARQWYWGVTTLYRTPGNDPVTFLRHCRAMMLAPAVLLGVMIALWSWRIGRGVAAVVATALFALDPNFIAHSSLMKNDIAFALSMFLLAWALWRAGRELTLGGLIKIALLCVVTLTIKFSGIVAVLLVPILLGLRVIIPMPWRVFGWKFKLKTGRLDVVAGILIVCALVSYAGIWAAYGFRFRPTPAPDVWLNLDELARRADQNAVVAHFGDIPPGGVPENPPRTFVVQSVLWANQCGLLPQPFLAGFLFTYANGLVRSAYLCGKISLVGWWWYFPFAMLVKTPITTIVAAFIAGMIAIRAILRGRLFNVEIGWTALCLAVPFIVFLASAMMQNLNIGLRHVLAVYPFAFVAIGWAASVLWRRNRSGVRILISCAGLLLAVESLSAYPNFIPYFNVIARNVDGGGLGMLSDSNLDWGQDLPLLANWQHAHPDVPLYLSYFGYTDPAFYKIKYMPLPGGYFFDRPPQPPDPFQRAVLAISATNLQGPMEQPKLRESYRYWGKFKLREVLGGTIYLFDYDPAKSFSLNPDPIPTHAHTLTRIQDE